MKKLSQAEARKIVPRLDWHDAPTKTEMVDFVSAVVAIGKDDTLVLYAPREAVEKLLRKPKPKPKAKVPDWEATRANCS